MGLPVLRYAVGEGERLVYHPLPPQSPVEVGGYFDALVEDYYDGITMGTPLILDDLRGWGMSDDHTIHTEIMTKLSDDIYTLGHCNESGVHEIRSISGRSSLLTSLGTTAVYFAEASVLVHRDKPATTVEHLRRALSGLADRVAATNTRRYVTSLLQPPSKLRQGVVPNDMIQNPGEPSIGNEIQNNIYEARLRGFNRPFGELALAQVVADLYHLNRLISLQ